jgi:hypothetical protein
VRHSEWSAREHIYTRFPFHTVVRIKQENGFRARESAEEGKGVLPSLPRQAFGKDCENIGPESTQAC